MDSIGAITRGTLISSYYNHIASISIKHYIKNQVRKFRNHKRIRILELGAGTGGMSTSILHAIKRYGQAIEYHYTDISQRYIRFGKQRYGSKFPFMKFSILDLEADVNDQGYSPGSFDIVFAAHVVHATKNTKDTLQNIKKLLSPKGIIVLNEVTKFQTFASLTCGLLDGWWSYEDKDIRIRHSPLLSTGQWQDRLTNLGFRNVTNIGQSDDLPHNYLDQAVIIGESDGLINF